MISNLVVSRAHYAALTAACDQLVKSTQAGAAHIIDRNGVGVTHYNREGYELDVDILSSLVSGNVATANALASLIGEEEFGSQIHQGNRGSFLVTPLAHRLILIVWFDEHSSSGLVKLAAKKLLESLEGTLLDIERVSGPSNSKPLDNSSMGLS